MGYSLIFLSILSFGLSNCVWVYPLKKSGFLQVIILRSFLTTLLFGSVLGLNYMTGVETNPSFNYYNGSIEIIKAIGISAFSYFGLFFYVKSLRQEKVSVAVPVSSISSFFGVLTAAVFLKEKLTAPFYITASFLLTGLFLIDDKPVRSVRFTKGINCNILAAFFWGVSFALFAFPVKAIGAIAFSFILEMTVCICSIFLFRLENKEWSFPIKSIDNTLFLLAILGFGGVIFYNLSFSYLQISIISLLSMLTPVVSVIAASLLFKERLTKKQYLGIAVILTGLTILNFRQ